MREAHFFEVVRGLCLWRGRSHVRTTENSRRDHLKLWLATKISKSQGCFGEWMCFRITSGCHSEWIRLVSGQFQRIRNVSGSEMDKTILVVIVARDGSTVPEHSDWGPRSGFVSRNSAGPVVIWRSWCHQAYTWVLGRYAQAFLGRTLYNAWVDTTLYRLWFQAIFIIACFTQQSRRHLKLHKTWHTRNYRQEYCRHAHFMKFWEQKHWVRPGKVWGIPLGVVDSNRHAKADR